MRRHLAYAAGAAVLALAGCGGDDLTPQVADPTSSPSVSASPSASAAVKKEAWEKKTDDGAVAFVEHWLEVFNEMQTTSNTADFEAIAASDCSACEEFVSITREISSEGGSVDSNGWSMIDAAVSASSSTSKKELAVRCQGPVRTARGRS